MSYHVMRILLYKSELIDKKGRGADVSVSSQSEGVPKEDLKSRRKSSLANLKYSAREITRFCSLFLSKNPNFLYVGPLISSCVFEAGLAWLVVLKALEGGDSEEGEDSMSILRQEFESDIRILVESLKNMGYYCVGALAQCEQLRRLHESEAA
jgi:hypothetical protein